MRSLHRRGRETKKFLFLSSSRLCLMGWGSSSLEILKVCSWGDPGSSQLGTLVAKRCCGGFLEVYRMAYFLLFFSFFWWFKCKPQQGYILCRDCSHNPQVCQCEEWDQLYILCIDCDQNLQVCKCEEICEMDELELTSPAPAGYRRFPPSSARPWRSAPSWRPTSSTRPGGLLIKIRPPWPALLD